MKKTILKLIVIGLVAGVVGGITFAFFVDQVKVEGNVFATGNADLEIRLVGSGYGWVNSVPGADWGNLYPGWSESYDIQLRNVSASPIGLDIIPRIIIKSDPHPYLRDVLTMQFYDEDEPRGPEWTLREWVGNQQPIEFLAHNTTGKIWTVKFSFLETGEDQSHFQNESIEFDLIFDGIQQNKEPLTEITNITQGTTHSTINNAISVAAEGDIIVVPEGEYGTGSSEVLINVNELTLLSDTSYWGRALLKGRMTVNADNVTIEGFDIWFTGVENKPPIDLAGVDGITIRNNNIRESNNDQAGISCWTDFGLCRGDILIENNQIDEGPVAGIAVKNNEPTNAIVKHNTVINPGSEGVWVWGVSGALSNTVLVIEDNVVINPGAYGIKVVDEPMSINGVTTNRCQKLLDDNPGIDSVLLEWASYTCTQ